MFHKLDRGDVAEAVQLIKDCLEVYKGSVAEWLKARLSKSRRGESLS